MMSLTSVSEGYNLSKIRFELALKMMSPTLGIPRPSPIRVLTKPSHA